MTTEINALKQQAGNLRKTGRWADALPLYEQLKTEHPASWNEWDHWGYAFCLRKLNRSQEALDVCRVLNQSYPEFEQGKNLYAWCIYDIGIHQPAENFDEGRFFKAANAILNLCKQEAFSAYESTVFGVVEHLKSKNNPSYPEMLRWLARLDPDLLSTEERPNRDPDARQATYPSNREKWYAQRAKALLETGQYELCIETVSDAQRVLPRFHPYYDAWFYWYRAKSAVAMKRSAEALADLDTMLKKNKHDFFVYHELAEAYSQLGEIEKALQFASIAALQKGSVEFKWKLFLLMTELFERQREQDLAKQHVLLALASKRESGGETMPKPLVEAMRRLQVPTETPVVTDELRRKLVPVWKKLQPQVERPFRGTIQLIHRSGKSGQVLRDDGKSYFFGVRSFHGPRDGLQVGLAVLFNLREEEGKNGQPEMHAVDLIEARTS